MRAGNKTSYHFKIPKSLLVLRDEFTDQQLRELFEAAKTGPGITRAYKFSNSLRLKKMKKLNIKKPKKRKRNDGGAPVPKKGKRNDGEVPVPTKGQRNDGEAPVPTKGQRNDDDQ
ncbi:unnamed protein product [Peronospora effusa]|nr:unnamed protein product [Peronospora effusa]